MFRAAILAFSLTASPVFAMDHAACIKLVSEAYEAKDRGWATSQTIRQSSIQTEKGRAAAEEATKKAFGASIKAQEYINALSDLCEALR